jgi:hypothetical protein
MIYRCEPRGAYQLIANAIDARIQGESASMVRAR